MILKGILRSWALLAPCVVAEQQKPLGGGTPKHEHQQQDSWRRDLNFSSPAPHLFASAYGLLQQWSNTVFPNGHTMAAVEIPAFTLLYHGRMDEEDAPSPEWLAFDIEMAYGIMGSTRQSFMLSYQTTRPVKALYFDGESAALMGLGQLDTQMLHLYGNVTGPDSGGGMWRGLEPEYERAMGLGMVWVDVFAEIVQRNAGHLMALEKAARWAGDEGNVTEVREWLYKLRGQSHMFLVSFLEYPNKIDRGSWDVQGPLFGETYSRCRYRYTRLLVDIPMKPWETDLRDAVEEIMGGICGVLLEVGFEVERAWYALEEGAGARLVKLAERWEDSVRGLRAWVGWEGEFIRCDKTAEASA
ncbi:hypothetical protein K4K59_002818 [Colletotrichum sp. SAR11_240]|nr:hypothetical protein K4K59_002818 [Colletotrichum sp. SAR11_240]